MSRRVVFLNNMLNNAVTPIANPCQYHHKGMLQTIPKCCVYIYIHTVYIIYVHSWAYPHYHNFRPTRTLLHIYNRHDHDHDHHDHDHHHHHHHIIIIITLNFATPYEQYVGWGNNINVIFMTDQNSPRPLNNMLIGVITSTLSSWRIKIRHALWTICWLG